MAAGQGVQLLVVIAGAPMRPVVANRRSVSINTGVASSCRLPCSSGALVATCSPGQATSPASLARGSWRWATMAREVWSDGSQPGSIWGSLMNTGASGSTAAAMAASSAAVAMRRG